MFDATFKLVIFGDAGCGKTTLTQRFLTNLFKSDSRMTIGVDFEVKTLEVEGKKVKLQIWDFGGEERFRFLLPTYVRGANAGLFMYDITRYLTFKNLDDWLKVFNETNKDQGQNVSTVLVGSKIYLEETRSVLKTEAENYAKQKGFAKYIECSSKSGENVDKVFETIAYLMLENTAYLKDT